MSGLLAGFVVIAVFLFGIFMWSLCRIAAKPTSKPDRNKILLDALNKTLDDYHAKRGTFAEERPTMPSQAEPMDEQARRRAPIRYPHRNAYDTRPCECEYCMEPTLRDTGEVDPPSLR